jgi:predicted nuclease of predicted toxin-antitoxin system
MKYLLDQGLARSTVEHLKAAGIESEHVGALGMAESTDAEVTLDSDFHALLAISNASQPSIIRIRIEGMKGDAVASVIQRVQAAAASELREGAAVTVTPRRISIRRLPINAR